MEGKPPRLLEQVRARIRARHYSLRTEKVYLYWIRRFIVFHGKRHPRELGGPEVERFLTRLAVTDRVAASTQNQALAAVLFLYREVLHVNLPWLDRLVRARRPKRLPVVLTREEVRRVLGRLSGTPWLVANVLYGTGMRLMECLQLRVKDVEFARGELVVRSGKGQKDRVTMLPAVLVPHLRAQVERSRQVFESDRRCDRPGVSLPFALRRKYPQAGLWWGWQYVFPARGFCRDPYTGRQVRHHLYPQSVQRAVRGAVVAARY